MINLYDIACKQANDEHLMKNYWKKQANNVQWMKFPTKILDNQNLQFSRWYIDGQINITQTMLDKNVQEQPQGKALIWVSKMQNKQIIYTYKQLFENVCKTALLLKSKGVTKGDRVIIFMPMIPQAIFAALAIIRLGAIHSIVFGGFAAKQLASRINDCSPKVIMAASCGLQPQKKVSYINLIKDALQIIKTEKPQILVYQRPGNQIQMPASYTQYDIKCIEYQYVQAQCMLSTDPLYILYTSGTTGKPKGIVRDHGGTAVAVHWTMKHIVGLNKKQVFFCSNDIGWVVGHTFCIYGPMMVGATTILYQGKPNLPHAGILWQIVQKYKPMGIYTAPTALRAIRKDDPYGILLKKYDTSSLRCLNMAGQRCDVPTYQWIQQLLGILINDHYWQTQIGWMISSNYMNLHTFKSKAGSATKPSPGMRVKILSSSNQILGEGELGKVCIQLPLPPSFMLSIYNDDNAFIQKYMKPSPGYYTTGDAGYFDKDGYLNIMTRLDDIINTAGHRLSTAAMQQSLIHSQQVVQAAVIGKIEAIKGQVPVAFIIPKNKIKVQGIQKRMITVIRKDIGPVASFQYVVVVQKLPKTKSGKILRSVLRRIIQNQHFQIPPTIQDQSAILKVKEAVQKYGHGLGKTKEIIFRNDIDIKGQNTQMLQQS